MLKQKFRIPQGIREGMDSCPCGLCFSMPDGRPILVNRQMNRLAALLTGHTVLDAETLWTELRTRPPAGGCRQLESPWAEAAETARDGLLCFALSDGTVWQLRRDTLRDGEQTYLQIEAADITELYSLSRELSENNRRLRELQERQRKLLANIVQINREKELVSIKMRVHDELGQCLLATTQALRGGTLTRDSTALTKSWDDALRALTSIPLESAEETPQEAELLQVAGMIGCRIVFVGERPADRGAARLLYAAVREALTNAVRHAGADTLTVTIVNTAGGCHAEIADNGRAVPGPIHEGDGLRSLRRRLEQEGAALTVVRREGVVLLLDLPCGNKLEGRQEK
jgi:signal transduction histidine kinase